MTMQIMINLPHHEQAKLYQNPETNSRIGGLHMTSSKHDYATDDQFATNFDMASKTIQCVFVSNLKLFGPIKTELWAKEVGEFSIM